MVRQPDRPGAVSSPALRWMLIARSIEAWDPAVHPRDHQGRFRKIGALDLIDGTVDATKLSARRMSVLAGELTDQGKSRAASGRLDAAVKTGVKPEAAARAEPWKTGATEDRIEAAYRELVEQRGMQLVSLNPLRYMLEDIPRSEMDKELKRLDREGILQLEPEPFRKGLSDEARDAAIVIGGEPKHLVFFRRGPKAGDKAESAQASAQSKPADPSEPKRTAAENADTLKKIRDKAEAEAFVANLSKDEANAVAAAMGSIQPAKTGPKARRQAMDWWQHSRDSDAILNSRQRGDNDARPAPPTDAELARIRADYASKPRERRAVPRAEPAKVPAAGPKPDPSPTAAELAAATSRAEGEAVLAGLTGPKLRALADELGMKYNKSERVGALRQQLLAHTVSRRLTTTAILTGGGDRPGTPEPGSPMAKMLADLPGMPKPAAGTRPIRHPAIDAAIRDAIAALPPGPTEWVSIADIREKLGNRFKRSDVDQALIDLGTSPDNYIIPVSNLKALKPRDHAAAVRIGNQDAHAIKLGPKREP